MAALRAAGAAERDPLIRNPDRLAGRFVSPGLTLNALVLVPGVGRLLPAVSERVLPGAYYFEIARVKHMDQVLSAELARGITQVAILGAGYDSRAYRFADLLRDTGVFEVDKSLIIGVKQRRVKALFGALPAHVSYVATDFVADDFETILRTRGYDVDQPTLLIISGVLPYLPDPTVERIMAFVRGHSAPSTTVVFDYALGEMVAGDDRFHGAREVRRRLQKLGEPMRSGIPKGSIVPFLGARGLELVSNLDPVDLTARYLTRGDGRVAGEPYGFMAIAHARISSRVTTSAAGA
jgi:methyltransferase (TIGR00027 family)